MPAARDFATPWAFRVQTASTWSGHLAWPNLEFQENKPCFDKEI